MRHDCSLLVRAGVRVGKSAAKARIGVDGVCTWVEVCFCPAPLQEEKPYWEDYFDLVRIQDAHARTRVAATPWSQPWITWPVPRTKAKGSSRSTELSNLLPSVNQPV